MTMVAQAGTSNKQALLWIEEMVKLCKPDRIYWCNGSEEERTELLKEAVRIGDLEPLNQEKLTGCYLHRSAPNDVARTEHLTFICTRNKEDAGPTNYWMEPKEAYRTLAAIFDGAMRGRTLYVVPFIMGQPGSPFSKVGIELTDSLYVALNMRIMTRMGSTAWKQLGGSGDFTRGLHSKADLNEARRYICHFPEDNTIWSVGSGYGGNALLGKKCLALRIASWLGRQEGWMAEHMLIIGVEDPKGEVTYLTGAFPSQCGKTNLAMLVPPASQKGYKVWTVGDDIAWLRIGPDGRLWATNPEAGFFGVAPGTNTVSNPNAMATIRRNTFYTNVLKKPDGTVWWEGMDGEPPKEGIDWRGNRWTPNVQEKGAHPNSRFTAPASQCPSISPHWEDPKGVPISGILFGGRRAKVAPLVYQARSWQHGVFVASTMASETTAAATGKVGVVRRDPMAMLPFCGYHMGDYFNHWLSMGNRLSNPPKIFHVNWFRIGEDGKFLWPGYGENLRVLRWIVERCQGRGEAVESPIGFLPTPSAIDRSGLSLSEEALTALLTIDQAAWNEEVQLQSEFFHSLGEKIPKALWEEHAALSKRLII